MDEQWVTGPTLTVQADGITDAEIRMCALTAAARCHGARWRVPYSYQILSMARQFETYLRGEDQ